MANKTTFNEVNDMNKDELLLYETNVATNFKRYSRSILIQLRNRKKSQNIPHCAFQNELQMLPIWNCRMWKTCLIESEMNCRNSCYGKDLLDEGTKSVNFRGVTNYDRLKDDSNSGGDFMLASRDLLEDSTVNKRQIRSIYYRNRQSSETASFMLQNTNGYSQNVSNTNYYIDHRSMSSSHLMPSFAKKHFRNTIVTSICSDVNNTKMEKQTNVGPIKVINHSNYDNDDSILTKNDMRYKDRCKLRNKCRSPLSYFHSNYIDNLSTEPHPYWTPLLNKWHPKLNVPYKSNTGSKRLERRIGSGRLVTRENKWDSRTNCKDKSNSINNTESYTNYQNNEKCCSSTSHIYSNNRMRLVESRPCDRRLTEGCCNNIREEYEDGDNNKPNKKCFTTATSSNTNDENLEERLKNMNTNSNAQNQISQQLFGPYTVQRTMSFKRSHKIAEKKDKLKTKEKNRDEPEWFTSGPTSQHETIDLHGFQPENSAILLPKISKNSRSSPNYSKSSFTEQREEKSFLHPNRQEQKVNRKNDTQYLSGMGETLETSQITNSLDIKSNRGNHPSPSCVNELLNFFDMDSMDYSLITTGQNNSASDSKVLTSRFSRWFPKPEDNIEKMSRNRSNSIEIKDVSKRDISLQSKEGETNTVMAFFQSNNFLVPDLPKPLPHSVLALDVEELEARMRLLYNNENTNSQPVLHPEISIRCKFEEIEHKKSITPTTSIMETPRSNQNMEVFKRLLNQLSGAMGDNNTTVSNKCSNTLASSPNYTRDSLPDSCSLESEHSGIQKNNNVILESNLKYEDLQKMPQQQDIYKKKKFQIQQYKQKIIPISSQYYNHNNNNLTGFSNYPLQHQPYIHGLQSNHTNQMQNSQDISKQVELQIHTQSITQNTLLKKNLEEKQQQEFYITRWQDIPDYELQFRKQPFKNFTLLTKPSTPACSKNTSVQNIIPSLTPMAFTPTSVLRKMTAEKDNNFQQQQYSYIALSSSQHQDEQQKQKLHFLQQQRSSINKNAAIDNISMNTDNSKTSPLTVEACLSQPRMILGGGVSSKNVQPQQLKDQKHFYLPFSMKEQQQKSRLSPQHQHQMRGNEVCNTQLLEWPHALVNSNIITGNKPIGRPILKGPTITPIQITPGTYGHQKQNNLSTKTIQQQLKSVQPQNTPSSLHIAAAAALNKIEFQKLPLRKSNNQYEELLSLVVDSVHPAEQKGRRQNIREISDSEQQTLHFQQNQQQLYQQHSLDLKQQLHHRLQKHDSRDDWTTAQGIEVSNNAVNYNGCLSPTSNQLAQWFSPELLAQASAGKLPLLNMNQALSLEEFERSIQHSCSTAVHN